ncbi:ferrous iron transport protein A [Aequitasia blattaphilus]|uniref:Ferrous iron transport protein A n=1 Tax=Aequitasia blattaphilus TaxID=2949332 RepID=A0ABT1E797_9FIRM|nr:ferrous iron transport protein A [Aequitasia blattaphilus]MCP1101484.1 ferrous iron transport protein A [Aequitasia blattaphilus]MCR8614124.1 ferrous iron transport protein A [Aequitasia blattaphilus]
MTLKQGKSNQSYFVTNISLELNLMRRLEALGLTQGTRILILNNEKKGSLTVKFRGTRFAIGKHIAQNIEVSEESQL